MTLTIVNLRLRYGGGYSAQEVARFHWIHLVIRWNQLQRYKVPFESSQILRFQDVLKSTLTFWKNFFMLRCEQRYNWTRGYKCCNGVEQMLSWSRWCRLLHLQKVSEERIQSIDLIVQSVFFIWSLAKTIQIHSLIRSSQVDSWRVSPNNFEQCSAEDLWKIDLQTNQPLIWRSSSVMAVRLSF